MMKISVGRPSCSRLAITHGMLLRYSARKDVTSVEANGDKKILKIQFVAICVAIHVIFSETGVNYLKISV